MPTKKSPSYTVSHEVAPSLFLVHQTIDTKTPTKAVETPTNHIAVIDCSGSMAYDLPKLREQLKKKLPKLLREGDTLSVIWFSGRGEFGALLEAEAVASLKDLNDVNKAVDRWLKPNGLTGFKEPLLEVEQLVGRVAKKNAHPFALFFMSDGCDNQWNRGDILKTVEQVAGKLASATFVEYGYYADRPLLSAMAEKAGGVHIHADAFDKYEVTFEAAMQKRPLGGKRVEVAIQGDTIGGFAYTLTDGEITTYDASTGKVAVAEDTSEIYYLAPAVVGEIADLRAIAERDATSDGDPRDLAPAYAALSLFATRMKPEVVFPILKGLGDVTFIHQFAQCFGKQKYSEFMEATKSAAHDPTKRFVNGRNSKLVPPDDAFTVLDLLQLLEVDDEAHILLDHPAFKYSRVSRGRVDADENLTADEALAVEVVRNQMAGEKSAKKLKELQSEIDKILANKQDALRFEPDPAPRGFKILGLTPNESSPNISVLVKKTGTVDLSGRPDAAKLGLPTKFPTHIFRNYAVIAHGLVNMEKLVVHASKATLATLVKHGVELEQYVDGGPTVINLKPLPIINRKMVKAVSAKTAIELEYALLKARAAQKVYKHKLAERFPAPPSVTMAAKYSVDAATWLKEQGITDGGFAPKLIQAASTDFILGKELDIKLKGCSKLDSVNAVTKKIAEKKKLNIPDTLMTRVMDQVDEFLTTNPAKLHEKWLDGHAKTAVAETRGLIYQSAASKFGVIVGQTWYSEFKSLDENTLTVKIDGHEIVGTCELREIEIKI